MINSKDDPPSLASWEKVLKGQRLIDDFAERGIQTWASPIDMLRLLLIRRDPKQIDPELDRNAKGHRSRHPWIRSPCCRDRNNHSGGGPTISPLSLRPATPISEPLSPASLHRILVLHFCSSFETQTVINPTFNCTEARKLAQSQVVALRLNVRHPIQCFQWPCFALKFETL